MDQEVSRTVLAVDGLRVDLAVGGGTMHPVDGVSFEVAAGESLGIVGESGSGKSLSLKAVLGLLPPGATAEGDLRFAFDGGVVRDAERVRGYGVAMVFQEPMTALNPTMRVGDLIAEAVRARGRMSRRASRARVLELMAGVGIPEPERRARMWPHELSGGLRQRVMIAAALATEPELLLCDEPTTALDVTVQAQILDLLRRLREERGLAMVFVSHDLAVVAEVCDRVAVMYAGRIVEVGPVDEVLRSPRHPYTAALLASAPSFAGGGERLATIPGSPPDPRSFPDGCRFAARCAFAREDCLIAEHELVGVDERRATACIHPEALMEVAR
ncbi:peptide/nickel transport system ATP-binding protein/peptide/nickel transport system permease protein [Agromyces sp. CF514]|uniref:ABC transporter ATP-binding protein n=1 Tax=Agromyces sp. CF514 TaxID=1881031 RepID=UPI0008E26F80|nr:ABC transporter ATP-binding protein [Agromyces sp. CF514]SFR68908.1 peptide/nickel transport system ATP-binding protein/peptide/nickel transport system permease protein [Agromyces sp. CF514]